MKIALSILSLAIASCASAHFVWVGYEAPTKQFRAQFAEEPNDSVLDILQWRKNDVRPITLGSKAVPMTYVGTDGMIAGSQAVVGINMTYGIMDRGQGKFLLTYYAKGARSIAEAAIRLNTPAELTVSLVNGTLVVNAWKNGTSVAGTEIVGSLDGKEIKGKTNSAGEFALSGPITKTLAVRTVITESLSGKFGKDPYTQVKRYATLVVRADSLTPSELGSTSARDAMRKAYETRYSYPSSFTGTSGALEFTQNGKISTGTYSFGNGQDTQVKLNGLEDYKASIVNSEIGSLFGHRKSVGFDKGDGRNTLISGTVDPVRGQEIMVRDRFDSVYWLKNDRITEVHRTIGGKRLAIFVTRFFEADGKQMSADFTMTETDIKSGHIESMTTVADTFAQVDGVWTPESRTSTVLKENAVQTTRYRFSEIKLALAGTANK